MRVSFAVTIICFFKTAWQVRVRGTVLPTHAFPAKLPGETSPQFHCRCPTVISTYSEVLTLNPCYDRLRDLPVRQVSNRRCAGTSENCRVAQCPTGYACMHAETRSKQHSALDLLCVEFRVVWRFSANEILTRSLTEIGAQAEMSYR